MEIKLIKHRDPGLPTYTWFWIDSNEKLASPFFNTENEALSWAKHREVPTLEQK